MRGWTTLAVIAFGSTSTLAATASYAAPFDYSCASAGGFVSEIQQFQAGPAYSIRGSIEAGRYRRNDDWLPTATVALEARDKSAHVGVQLMQQRAGKLLDINIVQMVKGVRGAWTIGTVGLSRAVPFSILIEPSRPAVVTFAGKSMAVPISIGPNARISITCSTGDFYFDALDWSPPPTAK